ncbi:MAG: methylglyoxal synthase [Planctomycetia bacterium]|nr:methylglyoxal synthase [Planctomycetia bacterium]MBL6915937.1 methylglyoxal synthase [Planctomycetota bacterium]
MRHDSLGLFSELSQESADAQFLSDDDRLSADAALIQMNEPLQHLVLLHEGQVQVETRSGETIIQEAPCILGEISFITGGLASATVRPQGPVKISRISFETLEERWNDPAEFRRIYSALTRLCIQRLSGAYHDRYIALVAHDSRKSELVELVQSHRDFFSGQSIISTLNTGLAITEKTGLQISRKVRTGLLGGDQQIGALVSEGVISAVIFLRDPLWAQPHSADVNALIRICEIENIPLGTNPASAEAIIRQLTEDVNSCSTSPR